ILEKISKKRRGKNLSAKIINSCRELAKTSEHGWETEEVKPVVRRIANYMNISLPSANTILKKNSKLAAEVAAVYNPEIAKYIPGHEEILQKTEMAREEEIIAKFPEPNPMLLLKILREISTMLQSNPDFNLVLGGLLEGIHRGVGMDRALFALYTVKSQIKAKFVLGTTIEYLRDNFVFPVETDKSNPFFDALFERRKGIWIKNASSCEYSSPIIHKMRSLLDVNSFFITPIVAGNNPIGIFYADRQPSKRPLDISSFENFEHLGQQACISIEYISRREKI
ncbi:MAG: GAF domain-containing protein, partial [Desulfobulbaceae bacterium]|nr:GAF domain-containing protein [Desulfobulbaceae bacterium]